MENTNNMIRFIMNQLRECESYSYDKETKKECIDGDEMDAVILNYMRSNNLSDSERKVVLFIFYMCDINNIIRK